ncbi:MAG: hypothetical protein IBX62_09595 [Coriobacteriia bacterium]|nr:hypothetical protein [Coriobacteriia bacterium]
MDWERFVREGALHRNDRESESITDALIRRAWSDVVDSRTALAVRDYGRGHDGLEHALAHAVEAYAAAHGYDRGPAWTFVACREIAVLAFGDPAAAAFEQNERFGGLLRDWSGDARAAEESAQRCVDAVSAFAALVESRLRTR